MTDKPPYRCKCGNPTWSPILKCDDCWRKATDIIVAQEKLEQARYNRSHFSDGSPVEFLIEFAPVPRYCVHCHGPLAESSSFGVIYEG